MNISDSGSDKAVPIRLHAGVSSQDLQAADGAELTVPIQMGRKGLRNLVYHLLGLAEGKESNRPDFHFLALNKEPLRTSLEKFLTNRGLSTETILDLTYYIPLPQPKREEPLKISEDWLSSVHAVQDSDSALLLLTGSYNGLPAVSTEASCIASESASLDGSHRGPIKGVAWLLDGNAFVTASQDETVKIWGLDRSNETAHVLGVYNSSDISQPTSFESVASNATSGKNLVALGGADGSVWLLADIEESIDFESGIAENDDKPMSKRRRPMLHEIHAQHLGVTTPDLSVAKLKWKDADLVTAGMDSMVRVWNTESCAISTSIPAGGKPITGLAVSSDSIAVCGFDGAIRLLDPREGKGVVASTGKNRSHTGAATDVSWIVASLYLASGGVDGCVRAWDVRSLSAALHTVENVHGENGRSLSLASGNIRDRHYTFSAGSDGYLQSISLQL